MERRKSSLVVSMEKDEYGAGDLSFGLMKIILVKRSFVIKSFVESSKTDNLFLL